jgi:hypothetical protein
MGLQAELSRLEQNRKGPQGMLSAHRADPKGHFSEKWTRFSLTRTSGSALNDAQAKNLSIEWVPKVVPTFRSDAQMQTAAGADSTGRGP